jgi:glycosyltransferase involved in cell wall biosynthesis
MKLTLALITFNEEKNIHYPLDSAYDIADEVVLIDGGSTDKTIEIVKSYGDKVKVFEVDNPPNFLQNKQRAIEKATGDWILQLDADEALSSELKEEIRVILSKAKNPVNSIEDSQRDPSVSPQDDNTFSGYMIPRKNSFLGRYLMKGGVYPDYVLRLYKREGAYFELKNVHENVKVPGEVGYTKEALLHFADPDFERYLTRWNRYTTFDAMLLSKEKNSLGLTDFISYFFIQPVWTFFMIYVRHKGFQDGFPGFVWALFSSIRFWAIYVKAWQNVRVKK